MRATVMMGTFAFAVGLGAPGAAWGQGAADPPTPATPAPAPALAPATHAPEPAPAPASATTPASAPASASTPAAPAPASATTPAPEPAPAPATAPADEGTGSPLDALPAPQVSGFVDVTYNYNTRDPMDGITPFHTYTARHDTVLLNAAHLALSGSNQAVTYAIELDIGTDAEVNSGDDEVDLQEAYLAYVSPLGLGIKAGKFATFSGIEVIESGMNPTISRGFLYGLAECFTHVGAVATYQISPAFDVALGVVNGWDVVVDNNGGKTVVGKLGYTSDRLAITASAYAGPEQPDNQDNWRLSGDLTGKLVLGPVDLWAQINAGREDGAAMDGGDARWIGGGLQPVWHAASWFALGGRAEVFSDRQGARTGRPQTLYNLSVAPTFLITSGLMVRGELRVDWSNKEVFTDQDGDAFRDQLLALTEAIYSF